MTSRDRERLGQRLQALAFWIAFGTFVTLLWVALPVQAAPDAMVADAAAASVPHAARPRTPFLHNDNP